ncbi:MAG: prepilin-type N-terminal cleavage/methylation domain-containing protein [Planctomycetes bacterium]|nr:prepilin-type N-terminal cleavage/methylation domain-containing protein [Planctomycetota bacterium]
MRCTSTRAFTLIEILVVLAILAGLLAMVAVKLSDFTNKGQESKTSAQIESLKVMLEQYRNTMGDYPPCELAALGVKAKNKTNEGCEALVLAFFDKRYDGTSKPNQSDLRNLEDDTGDVNITTFGNNALQEIVDAWENPIVYIRRDAYERDQEYDITDTQTFEVVTVQVKAEKDENTASFWAMDSYQLRSAGSDGKLGTDDDICSYR